MKKILLILLVVVVVLLALALTCPNEESFGRYVSTMDERHEGSLIDEAKDSVLSTQVKLTADYESYRLWATVTARRGTERRSYLGVFGIWLELGRDD